MCDLSSCSFLISSLLSSFVSSRILKIGSLGGLGTITWIMLGQREAPNQPNSMFDETGVEGSRAELVGEVLGVKAAIHVQSSDSSKINTHYFSGDGQCRPTNGQSEGIVGRCAHMWHQLAGEEHCAVCGVCVVVVVVVVVGGEELSAVRG